LSNSGDARSLLLINGINNTFGWLASSTRVRTERGMGADEVGYSRTSFVRATVDGTRIKIITSSNNLTTDWVSSSIEGTFSCCATRSGWRSRAVVFNNTSSSRAFGYLTFITSRNNAFGFSNALIVDAFVDLARIRSSTGLWEEFATSRCFVISDRDLTWARREDGLTFSSVDNVDDTSGQGITGSSGFRTSSLGFSDFVTIEGGLFTDSGREASSDGTGIGDAIFRAVGVWRRRDSTERIDFNAVSFVAFLWASIDYGTDLGGDIFAKTSSWFTDSVSQTSISSGFRACFVGL